MSYAMLFGTAAPAPTPRSQRGVRVTVHTIDREGPDENRDQVLRSLRISPTRSLTLHDLGISSQLAPRLVTAAVNSLSADGKIRVQGDRAILL